MSKSIKSLIAVCLVVIVGVVALFPTVASADDADTDLSLYSVASSAASYYDIASSTGEVERSGVLGKLGFNESFKFLDASAKVANAGGMIGFIDSDKSTFFGWAASILSSASQTYSYSSLSKYTGMFEYAYYGYALQKMGLDSTANETLDFGALIRSFSGGIMTGAYIISGAVDVIFSAALIFLQWVNPFHWFAESTVLDGKAGEGYPDWAAGIVTFVSNMYDGLDVLGWVVMPIFLVALIVSLLLFRKSQTSPGSKVKRFLIRLVFLVIGIPLLGSLYTSTLSWAQSEVVAGATSTDYIIASTFVDFESWAANGNLQVPEGDRIVINTGFSVENLQNDSSGTASGSTSLRRLARDINSDYSNIQVNTYNTSDTILNWNKQALKDTITNADTIWASLGTDTYQHCINLLSRYTTSQYYHSSDFETEWKASVGDQIDSVSGLMNDLADFREFNSTDDNNKGMFVSQSDGAADTTFLNNGSLNASIKGETTSATISYTQGSGEYGLSTLSMYNYLNTSFGETGLVVYSTNKATSGIVREAHHSVTLIGEGITSVLYYLDALVMLIAMIVIGIGYAFAIMFGTIKRGIKMIVNLPLAMLGGVKSIARIVTIVIMMVVNVFVTIIMYDVVQELLVSISEMIEVPFTNALDAVDGVNASILSGNGILAAFSPSAMSILIVVELVLVIIATIVFTVMAFKLRKKAVRAVDESIGQMLDKFFGESGSASDAPKGPNFVQKAAGAVGAGAGMALGQRLMGNAMGMQGVQATSGVEKPEASPAAEGAKAGDAADAAKVAEAAQAMGGATNPAGSIEAVSDGGAIQGGDKQTLAEHNDTTVSPTSSEEAEGRDIIAQNADSLGDAKSVDAGSGQSDEAQTEVRKEAVAEDIQSEAKKDAAKGIGKTVKGAVEAGVGAYTGNEQLVKKGAEDAADGLNKTKDAATKSVNADAEAEKQVQAEKAQQQNASGQKDVHKGDSVDEHNDKSVSNTEHSDKDSVQDDSRKVDSSVSEDASKMSSLDSDSQKSETKSSATDSSHVKSSLNAESSTKVSKKTGVSAGDAKGGAKGGGIKTSAGQKSPSGQKKPQQTENKKSQNRTRPTQSQSKSGSRPRTAQGNDKAKVDQSQHKQLLEKTKGAVSTAKSKYDNLSSNQKKVLSGAGIATANAVASKTSEKSSKKSSDDDFI